MPCQACQPGFGDVLQQPPGDVAFQAAARFEDVVRFFQAGARHRRAAIGAQVYQAFTEQARQHTADDGAADAEAFTDDVFGQLVAGQQGLLDDGAAQIYVYDFAAIYVFFRGLVGRWRERFHLLPWLLDLRVFL
ncbi:hypothetical protein D3C71_1019620 [compost metagenome]